ncbi:MAG TPA: GNAT family N-acetyltransferase [Candidatus Binataceae bacterium]|jgi:GNAT superfamily N-acetyltransferase
MAISVVEVDFANPEHGRALLELLDAYMRDPMEGGEPAPERVRRELIPGLRAHPACYAFFACRDGVPSGFAICFLGFSTFNARGIINIHDVFVAPEVRGTGLGKKLLDRIEAKARELDCCRLTLEVREDNHVARGLYCKFGFGRAEFGATRVVQEFWTKTL